MKILGIIVEYNPFHNGHIYHIKKAKELVKCDYTIAIMSAHFVQRGEPAIIDKWTRSRLAIEFGVDLVIELPFVYSCQSADYFAKGAIDLLHAIGVTDICFGSEIGDIQVFLDIANAIKKHNHQYNQYIQQFMKEGLRYPDACNQSLQVILGREIRTPNDLLGLSYVKEIVFHHYPITPHCFRRTNNYHDTKLQTIASASAIRQAILNKQDFSHTLPYAHHYQQTFHFQDFFPYIRYQILTSSPKQLQQYHMVEEGLENLLIKHIKTSTSMDDFVNKLLSKRYTKPRIQRMLIHILMKNTKEDIKNAMNVDYLRILAMNDQGRQYLNMIKKICSYHIITNIHTYRHPALDIELKATQLLSLFNSQLIEQEFSTIPYIKK